MGNGRKAIAPCGHSGEIIIGQYIRCDLGCDNGNPPPPPVRDSSQECPHCSSVNIEPFFNVWFPATTAVRHCRDCGKVFK